MAPTRDSKPHLLILIGLLALLFSSEMFVAFAVGINCDPDESIRGGLPNPAALETPLNQRYYTYRLPLSYDPAGAPHPLILAFHEGNGDAEMFGNSIVELHAAADAANAVLVFPQGRPGGSACTMANPPVLANCNFLNSSHFPTAFWDGLFPNCPVQQDVSFASELIKRLEGQLNIDSDQIFATGWSKGGEMVHRLGGELSHKLAAIAVVEAPGGGTENFDDGDLDNDIDWGPAAPGFAMPVMLVANALSEFFDENEDNNQLRWSNLEIWNNWETLNNCTVDDVEFPSIPGPATGFPGQIRTDGDCVPGATTRGLVLRRRVVVEFLSGGSQHRWPTYAQDRYDASQDIVDFFMQFQPPWRTGCGSLNDMTGPIVPLPEGQVPPPPPNPLLFCNGQLATHVGTNGNDIIYGTSGPDVILGLGGNDAIFGLGGDDIICAGPGHDYVEGNSGTDRIFGEDGRDCLYGDLHGLRSTGAYSPQRDHIFGGPKKDYIVGNGGADHLEGNEGPDIIYGLAGGDDIFGHGGDDYLSGGDQADTIKCGSGVDHAFGDDGADTIVGGKNGDTLYGGNQNDDIKCGAGFDTAFGEGGVDTQTACEDFDQGSEFGGPGPYPPPS